MLSLIAEGRTDAEIAAELATTEETVAEEAASIFDLLGLAPAAGHRRVLDLVRYLNR